MYVCLGRKIPWICMYIAKISHKTYICMFRKQDTLDMHVYSKIPHKNIHMFRYQKTTWKKKKKDKKRKKREEMITNLKKKI